MYKYYHHHPNFDLQVWGERNRKGGGTCVMDIKVTNADCVPTMCQAVTTIWQTGDITVKQINSLPSKCKHPFASSDVSRIWIQVWSQTMSSSLHHYHTLPTKGNPFNRCCKNDRNRRTTPSLRYVEYLRVFCFPWNSLRRYNQIRKPDCNSSFNCHLGWAMVPRYLTKLDSGCFCEIFCVLCFESHSLFLNEINV